MLGIPETAGTLENEVAHKILLPGFISTPLRDISRKGLERATLACCHGVHNHNPHFTAIGLLIPLQYLPCRL